MSCRATRIFAAGESAARITTSAHLNGARATRGAPRCPAHDVRARARAPPRAMPRLPKARQPGCSRSLVPLLAPLVQLVADAVKEQEMAPVGAAHHDERGSGDEDLQRPAGAARRGAR